MKVGLKETLSLLAAGYKKKDIEAMIAAEEEDEKETPAAPASAVPESAPEDAAAKESTPEPDYKKELKEKQKELDEIKEKLKKLQQDNIHQNSAPDAEKAKQAESDALTNLVRSFM